MADILIKGMAMPTDGSMIFAIRPDGMVEDVMGCYVGKAVPVPPHGDLVDRNEIIEAGKSHPTYKNSKIVKVVVDKACHLLKTATVVIPANKEE